MGRVRASKAAEIIAQFGGINPLAEGITKGTEGFMRGADLASTIAARKQADLESQERIKGVQQKIAQAKEQAAAQKALSASIGQQFQPGIDERQAKVANLQSRISEATSQAEQAQSQAQPFPEGGPFIRTPKRQTSLDERVTATAPISGLLEKEAAPVQADLTAMQNKQDLAVNLAKTGNFKEALQIAGTGEFGEGQELRGRDIQQKNVMLENGERMSLQLFETVPSKQYGTKVTWTDMSGNEVDPNILKGAVFTFAPQSVLTSTGDKRIFDPVTAEVLGEVSSAGEGASPLDYGKVTDVRKLSKEDREDAIQMVLAGKRDENAKKALKTLEHIKNIRKAVKSNNKVLVDRLGGQIQKFIGEDAGNLAQWEQRDPNSRAYLARLQQWYSLGTEGRLSDTARKSVLDLMDIYESNYSANITEYADRHAEGLTTIFPELNKNSMLKAMGYGKFMKDGAKESPATETEVAKVTPGGVSYTVEE